MKVLVATLTVIAVLGALVVGPVMAQQAPAAGAKTVEGKVMTVDPAGKSVTLDDGTKLTIPDSIKVSRADLKPGAAVKAAYEEKDGQKILTHLEIAK
jgi:Cu/Ag efflux protein CusF